MIEFIDRVPATGMSNKKVIEYSDGRSEVVTITAADNATTIGTPINRANLMALQGFNDKTTVFDKGKVIETNTKTGEKLTMTVSKNANGERVITEVFVGEKTITRTTTFKADGSILEVIGQ